MAQRSKALKAKRKEDALALAELMYDIFREAKDSGKLSIVQSDAKNTSVSNLKEARQNHA